MLADLFGLVGSSISSGGWRRQARPARPGVGPGGLGVVASRPAIIRASSAARCSSATSCTPLVVTWPSIGLDHDVVPVGEGGDLRQVGDHDHLGVPGDAASRRPISGATRPPTPASTSSKTKRPARLAGGEHHLHGQPDPGQLTSGGHLGQAVRFASRIRAEQQVDRVRPCARAGLGRRHDELKPVAWGGAAAPARRRSPSRTVRRRLRACPADVGGKGATARCPARIPQGQIVDPVVAGLQLLQPDGGFLGPAQYLVDRRPYFRSRPASAARRSAICSSRPGLASRSPR